MKNVYQEILELLQNGESISLATILDKQGSLSRSDDVKMIIRSDGSIIGTIGDSLERYAVSLSKAAMQSKQTVIQSLVDDYRGKGDLLIEFIDANDENNLLLYNATVDVMNQKEKAWLITMLSNKTGTSNYIRQQCLIKQDKTIIGKINCDQYILEKLIAGPAKISIHTEAFDNQKFIVESLRPTGTVYIFGAGHLSSRIAPLCETVGFRTVVLDDSTEYASRGRFTESTKLMVIESFNKLPTLEINKDSYVVIVTRGHLHDRSVLEQVLRRNSGYIGMIGSSSKREQVFNEMINRGFKREELDVVYSPIGTNIAAETPEELAISIVGELIKVRAEKENMEQHQKKNNLNTCCRILNPDA